ncbi:hypothetical protein PoB_007398100 [Plakobranchus ocellatus]|uniref:Uncharacterized protein n=1 Tax=Plakobranchus ocellatus TaxID=259542 RepID=A0AAV4DUG7_9GAST|nr:hypothetical protein PoB_007398100 [Plakobranchus ocellatus]
MAQAFTIPGGGYWQWRTGTLASISLWGILATAGLGTGLQYSWWGILWLRTAALAFDIPGGGYWREQTKALGFDVPGGGHWRRRAGTLAFHIPGFRYPWWEILRHWPSISLVWDIGDGGLEDRLLISLVGDIGDGELEH